MIFDQLDFKEEKVMDNEKIEKLQQMIDESNHIVFFGGAGVSTESHIPDFRSTDGLYHQTYKYPPEVMVSHTFYTQHTEEFYDFYKTHLIYTDAKPNKCHEALYELEKMGKLKAIVTQNIDGLHQKAGSSKVYELHGSVLRNYCVKCREFYDEKYVEEKSNVKSRIDIGLTGAKLKSDREYYVDKCIEAYNVFSIKMYGLMILNAFLIVLLIYQISKVSKIEEKRNRLNKDDAILYDEEENVKI